MEFEELIGIPFKTHGRDLNGFDCYGLAIYVSRGFGHELPDFQYKHANTDTVSANYTSVIAELGERIEKVRFPNREDLILFFDDKHRATHIGVAIDKYRFIHCDAQGVRVSRFDSYGKSFEVYKWQK